MSAKIRTTPRISVNKLGEYMIASASRRRSIVKDQKEPKDFVVARYAEAYGGIRAFFESGGKDIQTVEAAIEALEAQVGKTDWQEQDRLLSIQALERFLDISDAFPFDEFEYSIPPATMIYLNISGVDISVRPEVLLQGRRSNGEPSSGAVKLCFSKNAPIDQESGHFIATTLHQYLTDVLRPGEFPEPKHCFVFDIFSRTIHTAPTSYKRRRTDISAACEEITRAWAAL